jgi:hypothetical protein
MVRRRERANSATAQPHRRHRGLHRAAHLADQGLAERADVELLADAGAQTLGRTLGVIP